MANRLFKLAREPLLQFWLIGACIYAAYGWLGTPAEGVQDSSIVVDAARLDGFVSQWQKRWNRPPTRQELDGVVESFVREEILYRQAVAMGLDQDDPVTRRRMAQKVEFLTSDIALYNEPVPGELQAYLERHETRYRDADLISFRHVFFDPDERGESFFDDVARTLSQLQAADDPATALSRAGDRFVLQSQFEEATRMEVQREMGSGFTDALVQLEPGVWHGPVLSGYGTHLVYVFEIRRAPSPKLADVEQRVLEDWQGDQQDEFNEKFYQSLKSRYDIVIAEPQAGAVLEVRGRKADDVSDAGVSTSGDGPAS